MDLYLVRHAIAEERDETRWPDDRGRPLTPSGETRFRQAARGVRALGARATRVYSSPLVRAWQTAEILAAEAGWAAPVELPALEPYNSPEGTVANLPPDWAGEAVAFVGHEPHLHLLAAHLLSGDASGVNVEFKKGAIACLEVDDADLSGRATLKWLLPPKALRALAAE